MEQETTDEDEIVTTEIDGELKQVMVIDDALEQKLFEETLVYDGEGTKITVEDERIHIEPLKHAFWGSDEIQSLDESNVWQIINIASGTYGPKVTVERVE